ncbi:ubiquitin-related domain-containing protein [Amylocarpus encephaloides]|uniref:Ubiquitin-related domain-containing protein n=1 Tax=Amylocarpus encephaloides TaxID=45428 RepID=A0A9P8C255_9HELO|nr:ubiquitin-related domain-containing protein [Amylocarpus encephaloides]
MAPSDLSVLLDMGFEKERAELAVKKTGGIQGALQWLEDNQDKSIEEITTASPPADADETNPNIEPEALKEGEVAKSLVCNVCGKKFRSMAQAEFHASKTEHVDFGESTEEIAPLTEDEKKARLAELKANVTEKRAKQALLDKEEQRKNEKIRQKATREVQDLKEDMARQEQIKAAAKKREEKMADIAARKRIQEKIAEDKEERRLKAERAKAEREGRAVAAAAEPVTAPVPAGERRTVVHTETRLRLQLASGTVQKAFGVDTTLFEVAQALQADGAPEVESFTMTFPLKTFTGSIDFSKTLREAGLVPSAVLIVK